jgi:23S rRNA (guanine2445-N2)-methyltransferase / 23S rRNA (guanine2069-N7)-methyltransferase
LGRWARRQDIHCYRLYDADIPEYAVAVDLYEDWVHVQEYEPPRSVDQGKARRRLAQIMAVIPAVFELPSERVFLKVRKRQKGLDQYQKIAGDGDFHDVREGPCRFWVNFTDYLDTGLFLDQRPTRQLVGRLAEGRRFLNLFAYTGAASVYAALGGARSTLTLDMSRTYLDWAQRNFALNKIAGRDHSILRADCLTWLDETRERFDLIFLDPPTFSNSKRMPGSFDVQRDHVALITKVMRVLKESGVLIFSSNLRRFKMDRAAIAAFHARDITRQTIPKDFERNPRIHHCWRIEHRPST